MTTTQLASEQVVVQSPMSLAGSAKRIWKMTRNPNRAAVRWPILIPLALTLIAGAWAIIVAWYLMFGLLIVPYRLLRRGDRKRKRQALQHREMLQAANRAA